LSARDVTLLDRVANRLQIIKNNVMISFLFLFK
jgi:hypothetical protein